MYNYYMLRLEVDMIFYRDLTQHLVITFYISINNMLFIIWSDVPYIYGYYLIFGIYTYNFKFQKFIYCM